MQIDKNLPHLLQGELSLSRYALSEAQRNILETILGRVVTL
jgi:hypothetical protein